MVDVAYDTNDRWNIPDDRQLALRGRLQTGWSSYQQDVFSVAKKHSLNEDEQYVLKMVLEKKEKIQQQEQARIGGLVKKLDDMRSKVLGDGNTTCLICGTKAGLLKDQLRYCFKCTKMVCPKCSIDTKFTAEVITKAYFCVLCYEERQLWKRSGAWFFNSMPKYTLPESDEYRYGTLNRHAGSLYGGRRGSRASSILDLHQNDESDSIDEASDSSDDDHHHTKTFAIPDSDRRSWQQNGLILDDDVEGIASTSRRNAVSARASGEGNHVKKQASKTSSSDSDDHISLTISPHHQQHRHIIAADRKYNSQLSLPSSENSGTLDERRGSMTSLSSAEGTPNNMRNNKNKLGIHQRVLRKLSREDDSAARRSPRSLRKTTSRGSDTSLSSLSGATGKNVASTEGSEQDIDAMFKDYENEQSGKAPEQKEYTGKVGMIEFTLQYDQNTQELLVIVHSCKGLKGDKGKSPTLPYVKTYILPEAQKATKKRTSSMKKTDNPVYNETLVYYGVSGVDIENKGLKLSVMDETKVGSNAVIGESSIPLKTLSTRPVQQFRRILDLKSNDSALFLDTKKTLSNPGRIELALHYLSKQGKLVIGVIRCSGLKAMDPNGYSDPYVKCYLLPDPNKRTKQKTQVKKKTLNPEFNEEFTYKIPHSELAKRTLHISVWDYDMGRTNDFIGGITLGIEASGDLLRHWFETLQTQDRRVIKWHTLSETCPIIKE